MPTRTRSGLHPVTPKKLFASSLACSIRFHIGQMNLAVGYQPSKCSISISLLSAGSSCKDAS